MSTLAIGTQVQLIFRTQFLTFTSDQFSKALTDKEYREARDQIPNPQNPQAPILIQTFSKGDVTVFLPPTPSPNPNPIVFQILNTVNLEPKYKEAWEILHALNIFPEIVSDASFSCTTRIRAKTKPLDRLTSLVNQAFLDRVSKNFSTKLNVASIRLSSVFPLQQREGGCIVIIEPLASNPESFYFLNISYKTTKMDEFDRFISEFGSDMVQRIIEETEENV